MHFPAFSFLDLLFEWLYKNDSLKALSEAGYFDNALTVDDIEFSSNDSVDKRNGWHPEYFEDEENFCDNLAEVIKLEFGPFEKNYNFELTLNRWFQNY